MNDMLLKYGCNPNQKPSKIFMNDGGDLPIEVLNGPARLHQFSRRVQQLAACPGARGGDPACPPPRLSSMSAPRGPRWGCP